MMGCSASLMLIVTGIAFVLGKLLGSPVTDHLLPKDHSEPAYPDLTEFLPRQTTCSLLSGIMSNWAYRSVFLQTGNKAP